MYTPTHRMTPRAREAPIGVVLRALRLSRGLSQEQAAARCGISVDCWRRTERGVTTPSRETLVAVAAGFDVAYEHLALVVAGHEPPLTVEAIVEARR